MSAQISGDRGPENTWDNLEESVKKSVISLRDFARRKEKDFQFVISLSPSELAGFLKEFFLALKEQSATSPSQSEDENGAAASLGKIRSDLCDYFKKVMSVDITTGSEFSECNLIVDDVAQSQTKDGSVAKNAVMKKHTRQRTFTFETNELRQIYMSEAMNLDQPETLQNKVFFDVCMYICNRGKDFLRLMTKNDFEVCTDQNGRRYVLLKYDPKFSSNEVAGGTQIGERMYERPGDPKCPVYSYTQYVIHLHPMSDAFWQRPKRSILPTDFVWYDNQSIGNSTLNRLMNRITQSAGLPDSYAINAIKSSYIPVIESICRSALFGSQQFRRILQIKQSNHDMHYHVRKRHSEGSLSIASVLRESPIFRPRNSEPLLPLYRPLSTETELTRSSSTSPVPRAGSWDSGSPHMMPHMTPERKDTPETGYQPYRNCEPDLPSAGYQSSYRDSSPNGAQDLSTSSMSSGPQYHEEERKTMETGTIQQAKQKCLEIVHSLEVRDIKSFINWMKTFEAKHGPSGLMVTCQPVNAGEAQMTPDYARTLDSSVANGYTDPTRKPAQRTDSQQKMQVFTDFEAKDLEFDCIGDTFCCTSDVSPVKITIPAQDTVLLTGLQQNTQVLIHRKNDEKQSSIDIKYMPLHMRVLMSSENYTLQDVETVVLKKQKDGPQFAPEMTRSNYFKEDKSIPMKKRIVLDQESQNLSSQCNGSPQQSFCQSHSPPSHSFPHHTSPYMAHASYPTTGHPQASIANTAALNYHMAPGPPQMLGSLTQGIPAIPKYRERFPDGWGYTPLQKRQKFGMQHNGNGKDGPLDLIKPS